MNLIRLVDVTKTYNTSEVPVTALKGINVEIEKRSFVSFIGPSGSGKSTLLNLLGALDRPSSGTVTVNGVDVARLERRQSAEFRGKTVGFIFQNFNLIPVLTVFENIEYPLLVVARTPLSERRKRVTDLLERVGMLPFQDKFPNQISGGQKQRVAVARALVTNPLLVLADEPTANLDHQSAYNVIQVMHEMQKELGTTFVFSTHDPKIVGEAEIVYTLEDGAIVNRQSRTSKPN